MAKLSQRQIALLWIAEGGNPAKADEASAVAMAESGGDTKVHTPGSCCHGLYQFHHDYFSVKCALSAPCATRMAIKLSENGKEWEGGRWEAHENGAYRQFLGKSGVGDGSKFVDLKGPLFSIPAPGPDLDFTNPLGPLSPINPLDGIPSVQNPFGGASLDNPLGGIEALAKSVNNISAFFVGVGELLLTPEGWVRLAKLLGGVYLILKGLGILIRNSTGVDVAQTAKKTVSKAVETAAVVATVK